MGKASRAKRDRAPKVPVWTAFERMVKLTALRPDSETWLNSRYQVELEQVDCPAWPGGFVTWLSIKRLDKAALLGRDWRDLQRIKNELVGPEHEALEMFPAESRLVDTSNQYHLWVMATPDVQFPFGYRERLVMEGKDEYKPGHARQRSWEDEARPNDITTEEDAIADWVAKGGDPAKQG